MEEEESNGAGTMMTLDTIMSTDLITIRPEENLAAARSLMHDNKIHHLPVVDDSGELVGLVTLTNVLAATDSFLRDDDSRIHAKEIIVRDMMVTDVATVDEHASLRQAALFLERHRIGCLPVMSEGTLKGIITDTDFVGVAINLLEQIEETEPFDEDVGEDLEEAS
jgi:CBS domain-containing protein